MECAGTSIPDVDNNHIPRGGVHISGQSYRSKITWVPVTGGAVGIGGSSTAVIYVPAPLEIGGAALGGVKGSYSIEPAHSGGAEVNGSHDYAFFAWPRPTGNAQVSPKHKQTFIDYYIMTVRVKVGTKKARSEILKFYETHHLGYCRAMASENICTIVSYPKELIPPTNNVSVPLPDERFRIQHEPGWCEVEEKCKEGVLPKVIQRRQDPHLPPKIQRVTPRDRRIATLDAL
jgi:hypothetical protein